MAPRSAWALVFGGELHIYSCHKLKHHARGAFFLRSPVPYERQLATFRTPASSNSSTRCDNSSTDGDFFADLAQEKVIAPHKMVTAWDLVGCQVRPSDDVHFIMVGTFGTALVSYHWRQHWRI